MLEQAFNYVEDAIGGSSVTNSSDTSKAGDMPSYSCKIQPYCSWSFIFACWLLQYTIHAYIVMLVFSLGSERSGLGKINAACVMLAYGLFFGSSRIEVNKDSLCVYGVAAVPEIPISRIKGLDVKAGWISNLLTVHYANSAGKASKLTFWALDPQQLAHEIQSACAGAKGRN